MMQTRCPACATVFRVTPEQLKARHGKVRCGKCQHVFDALESLVDAPSIAAAQAVVAAQQAEAWPKTEPMTFGDTVPDTVPEAPPPPTTPSTDSEADATVAAAPTAAPATEPPAGDESLASLDETLVDTSTMAPTAAAVEMPQPAAPEEAAPVTTAAASVAPAAPEEAPPAETPPAAEAEPPAQAIEPLLHDDIVEAPRQHAWPWVLASLLALLVLALQTLVQFRVEAAVLAPELKPVLHTLCGMLDCDVPLPRKADQLSIETSDLHPDPHNKGLLILAATLKNRAPFAQTYPHLELTLTDTLDQPLLRKIIAPAEYLPKGGDVAAGFAANREIAVNLALIPESAGKAAPAGYRLYLFYP